VHPLRREVVFRWPGACGTEHESQEFEPHLRRRFRRPYSNKCRSTEAKERAAVATVWPTTVLNDALTAAGQFCAHALILPCAAQL